MIGHHPKLKRSANPPTAKDIYEAMAATCCSHELLLKNLITVDPTTYEKTQDIPIETIFTVVEKNYQWARDAALALGYEIRWPGVPLRQQLQEDIEGNSHDPS